MSRTFPTINQCKTVPEFRERLQELNLELPVDDQILSAIEGSPLARPGRIGSLSVGNRWCIHPMEGWDANPDGTPSELTLRRWQRFGQSGAKLIWGGEAAAIRPDGRANPNQTLATRENRAGLEALLLTLKSEHRKYFGTVEDLAVGLQLTHSGRFCRPNSKQLEPRIAYHHPLLDAKFGISPQDQTAVLTDDEVEQLIEDFVAAARVARDVGFQFVDVKACHGYLLHEFLSARTRSGKYGGNLAGRTRLLQTVVQQIQRELPGLTVVVRISIFDIPPFRTSHAIGQPMEFAELLPYQFGFGSDVNDPLQMDLSEPLELIGQLQSLGVAAINISCGSPYYNPHIQRPAIYPPSDGYQPPEDPLVGVARQIHAARQCQQAYPSLPMVGTGYTYLQDFLPQVAQAVIRAGWIDYVGLGRMVLSYADMPADTLAGRSLQRKRVCRTFSDCTTGPRNGLVSGCFPLDPFYKQHPAAEQLKVVKQALKTD